MFRYELRAVMRCLIALGLGTTLVACGSGGGGGGNSGGGSPGGTSGGFHLTAKIDGAAWTSNAGAELVGVPVITPGLYTITGAQLGGSILTISLYNIAGPGTYAIGVGPTAVGGSALVSDATGGWATIQSGADGSITIATLTPTRMTGTFTFTANAISGSASGTRTVTEGAFDLEVKVSGTIGPLPDNAGSTVTATLDGAPWNAATIAGNLSGPTNILSLAASNNARNLTMTLADVATPGTYVLSNTSPVRQIGVSNTNDPLSNTWSSLGPGGGGSVTITSITATRIQGTFFATLVPAAGTSTTGTVTIATGTFDRGRPIP